MAESPEYYSTRKGMQRRANKMVRSAVQRTRNFLSQLSTQELIDLHRDLHDGVELLQLDSSPEYAEDVLEAERRLTRELQRRGLYHWHQDPLAQVAGTLETEPPPAPADALADAANYIHGSIGLAPGAVSLLGPIGEKATCLYAMIHDRSLSPFTKGIVGAINRTMPPGLTVKELPESVDVSTLAKQLYIYDLRLSLRPMTPERDIISLSALAKEFRANAIGACQVFKDAGGPIAPFEVVCHKEHQYERVVTGVVLEPGIIDASPDVQHGTVGDTYDEDTIRQGMYWWMENSGRTITYLHQKHNGVILNETDVVLLENWQTRVDQTIGGRKIRKGTWMATDRVRSDALWQDILSGHVRSWSAGLSAMGWIEQRQAS